MSLQIHNTLSGKKEVFKPLSEKKVMFYACGVTVYDACHIGHARAYVAFDCMRRYLMQLGYQVQYVQNFTDIDDKIIDRAQTLGISTTALTDECIEGYYQDMDALGVMRADQYPRATDYIPQMIQLIETLLEKNIAYVVDGDVCFSVEACPEYGKLSKRKLDDMEAGSRVDVNLEKRNAFDFVLWKSAKPGEPSWPSPFGEGRPGWHLECSAMVLDSLGSTIDIHAGGEDLIFPHHENEIAQSECATGCPFARYWVHNGFVNTGGEKMSKSKQNFYTVRDLLTQFSGEALRFYLLRVHYRTPFNFSIEGITESQQGLDKLKHTLTQFSAVSQPDVLPEDVQSIEQAFYAAMDDDFNYAQAVGHLFELNKMVHRLEGVGVDCLDKLGKILGLFQSETVSDQLESELQDLIEKRTQARANKDFKTADEMRDQLAKNGILLEDTPQGVRWYRQAS